MLLLAFLTWAVQLAHVTARSSGSVSEACTTMTPNHGHLAQSSDPPFAVTFESESYTPGTPVTVILRACTSDAFKGFMIQAQLAANGADTSPLGRFNVETGTQQLCTGNAALVHMDSSAKTALTLVWNPPSSAAGHIVFRVTFVQAFDTFWTKVTSAVLRDASLGGTFDPDANAKPTTVAATCGSTPQGDSIEPDPACGATKGCFSDCQASTCTFSVSWQENGEFGVYSLQANIDSTDSYIALGFSDDRMMGGDSVTGCKLRGTDVTVFNAITTEKVSPTEFTDAEVTIQESSFQNNILACTFQQPKAASADGNRFDLLQNWTLLFAKGNLNADGDLTYHEFRTPSEDKYSLTAASTGTGTGDSGSPPTQPPPTGSVVRDPQCGVSKGCFTGCEGSSCRFVVSWEEDGAFGVYTLSGDVASGGAWMAVGFSTDNKMGRDSITGCAIGSDNTVVLVNGETTGKVSPTLFTDNGVTLTSSSFSNGVLMCTFRRNTSASDDGRRFDITQSLIYLFATGSASVSNGEPSLSIHSYKVPSSAKFSVSDTTEAGASALEYPLIKAHGSLMIGAWIFFASIGIVAARYCKLVWKDMLCSNKVWFQIHRTCMVLVFCCTVAGFVIIFVEIEDWSDIQGKDYQKAHPILGVIVTSLAVINPLMALIRPHPGTPHRPIFNWAHWFVGTCAHILGVITIFFGTKLVQADAPDYLIYILAGYVAWQVLVELVLTGIQCCCVQRDKKEVYELGGQNDVAQRQSTVVETEQALTLKKIIFVVHVFVVTAITAVLIALLAVGKTELDK